MQRTEISTALWLSFEYKLQEYSQSKEKNTQIIVVSKTATD